MKAALTALPAGLASLSSMSKPKSRRGRKETPLAREGQDLSAMFNVVASRPYPSFTRLEQSIRVIDTYTTPAFISSSLTVPVGASVAITLSSFPNITEYTNCFDQYRFDQIEVWLEPIGTQEGTSTQLVTCVDLDDANVPSSPASIEDKQGALSAQGIQGRYHRFRPHVAVAEFAGTFTGYGNVPATFIDSASPAVQHYGFKAATAAGGSLAYTYQLTVRAVITFRGPGL